jgi:Xaa-Pro aminopeptidase
LKPYADFFHELRKLAPTLRDSKKKLITDSKTSLAVEVAVGEVSSDARHSGLFLLNVSPHFNRTTLSMNDP